MMKLTVLNQVPAKLEFTPLEFETINRLDKKLSARLLEFTPLEFETYVKQKQPFFLIKLEFTPLEFETHNKFCLAHL